jgi:hypothetical protein
MKESQTRSQAVGARRLRRFSVRTVLDMGKAQVERALKRRKGRAPFLSRDSTSEFGFNLIGEPPRALEATRKDRLLAARTT